MNKEKNVKPWDLFNKKAGRVTAKDASARLAICKECPFFIKLTKQCTKCGCIMTQKTKLADASCPIGKWDKIKYPEIKEVNE